MSAPFSLQQSTNYGDSVEIDLRDDLVGPYHGFWLWWASFWCPKPCVCYWKRSLYDRYEVDCCRHAVFTAKCVVACPARFGFKFVRSIAPATPPLTWQSVLQKAMRSVKNMPPSEHLASEHVRRRKADDGRKTVSVSRAGRLEARVLRI